MERDEIYEQLKLQIADIARKANTERVMAVTNALLDKLIELNMVAMGRIDGEDLDGGRWTEMGTY